MIETVLCVDIGTTSLKSGLITDSGEVVSFYAYRFENPCDRFIAMEWLQGFNISVRRLFEKAENSKEITIKGISISGNGPTVVLPNGITVRWNEKTPVYNIPSEEASFSLFLPKLLAIKNLFTKYFDKADYVFSGPEFLIYQLTKKAVTVLPESRFERAYWNNDILTQCDIKTSKLPPFIGIGELCGNVTKEVLEETQLNRFINEGTPVFSAGPDFVAALIGTNTLEVGRICDRSGSSEGFNFCVPSFIVSDGARSLPSVIPGLWNISVLTPSSSKLSTVKRLQRAKDSVEKLRSIAKENNLVFPESMVVTGGQAKSNEYMIKKAHLLKMNLVVSNCIDAELIGDACAGWMGLGKYPDLHSAASAIFRKSVVYEGI